MHSYKKNPHSSPLNLHNTLLNSNALYTILHDTMNLHPNHQKPIMAFAEAPVASAPRGAPPNPPTSAFLAFKAPAKTPMRIIGGVRTARSTKYPASAPVLQKQTLAKQTLAKQMLAKPTLATSLGLQGLPAKLKGVDKK
jgi:hypothetical protein